MRGFALFALLACAGLALFVPGVSLLFHLPVIKNVWPMRWLAPAVLFVAWLAALGAERLLAGGRRLPLALAAATALLAAAIAVAAGKPAAWHAADRAWAVQRLADKYETTIDGVLGHVQAGAPNGADRFAASFARLAAEGREAAWWLAGAALWFWVLALCGRERQRRAWLLAAGIATAVQLGWHGATVTHGISAEPPPATAVHAFLRERAGAASERGDGGFAVVRASVEPALPAQLPPGQLMVPGLRDLHFYTHYDARSLEPVRALLGKKWGDEAAAKGYLTLSLPDAVPTPAQAQAGGAADPTATAHPLRHPLLDMLGVRYVLASQALEHAGVRVGPELRSERGEFFVYERKSALPRAFTVPGLTVCADDAAVVRQLADERFEPRRTACVVAADFAAPPPAAASDGDRSVRFVEDHTTRIELDVGGGAAPWLVLADTWLPGWTATIDGAPAAIVRGNHSQRLVQLPARACRVVFSYACPGLALGFVSAGIATLALFVFTLATARPRRGA
jgi:hypothetical protein